MPFSRSPRLISRCRTIPVCCTWRPPSAHWLSEFSARLAPGTGLRSTRSPQRSKPPRTYRAVHATSRSAASAITGACATFPLTRSPCRSGKSLPVHPHARRSEPRIAHLPATIRAERLSQLFERNEDIRDGRLIVLVSNHCDRSSPHRAGKAGLARREDCDERHAERRREMDEPGIHADDEGCSG